MRRTPLEPSSFTTLSGQVEPAPHRHLRPLDVTLGVLLTAATLILLAVLWLVVGRPVENATGALVDGLAAVALAFCLLAVAAAATGAGIARLVARP